MMDESGQIRLEEFTCNDFQLLINWIDSDQFMFQFAGPAFTFPITTEQLAKHIEPNSRKVFKVVETKENNIIGHCELNNIDKRNKSARISRLLIGNPKSRNKGFGKKMIQTLLKYAFEELHLHRIDLGVFDFNKGAIRCYKQCGFKTEGLLRDSFVIENQFHSVYNMSILKPEWIKLKN